jgi:enoyl reductase
VRNRLNRLTLALILLAGFLAAAGIQASSATAAGLSSCGTGNVATVDGEFVTIESEVCISSSTSSPGAPGYTQVSPNNIKWTPPPCWWAPLYTPNQLEGIASGLASTMPAFESFYVTDGGQSSMPAGYQSTDGPDYWDWNIGATPSGMWWGLAVNQEMLDAPATNSEVVSCVSANFGNLTDGVYWYWSADNTQPPAALAGAPVITDEDLAEYAAASMDLPTAGFFSSPTAGTDLTVNLPTWLWLSGTTYAPQTLTLCWAPTGNTYCSTVVATPQTFTINTTAPIGDYTIFNGGCVPTTEPDGAWIGTPYGDGNQSGNPPCGITYTHSSIGVTGGFGLSFTVAWSVTWDGGAPPYWPVQDSLKTGIATYPVQEIENIGGN